MHTNFESSIKDSNCELDFLAGVIDKAFEFKMKRTIFRVSRSTAIISFWDINDSEHEVKYKRKNNNKVFNKIITY